MVSEDQPDDREGQAGRAGVTERPAVLRKPQADFPPEQYAYRPRRNAQQAVVEVEALLFRGHPEVVDADLADYLDRVSYCSPCL